MRKFFTIFFVLSVFFLSLNISPLVWSGNSNDIYEIAENLPPIVEEDQSGLEEDSFKFLDHFIIPSSVITVQLKKNSTITQRDSKLYEHPLLYVPYSPPENCL